MSDEKGHVDWETIRLLCAEAGLGPEFEQYEQALGANLKSALVNHFGKANLYLNDERFRSQVNELIAVIVGALTHTSKPHKQTVDMEELNKIFRDEAGL